MTKGKNKKVIRSLKGLLNYWITELGGKIMINFVRLGAKTNSYLKDDDSEDKKAKGNKNLS